MKEWQYYKLDELGTVRRGRSRHRPRNAPHLYEGKYPFVQTADIKAANLYITSYTQTYSEAGLAQSKLWEPGTLCITIAANIADTAILGIPACFPDSVIGFTPYEGKSDARYIKYYFDIFQKTFQQISQGATQDNLSAEKLLSMKIPAPPLPTQQKIAGILSAYDDLIENNLKRIKLLAEMAQITYEEWFVRMRFPGYESTPIDPTTGLPEGWEKRKMSDFCSKVTDGTHDSPKQSAKGYKLVTGKHIIDGFIDFDTAYLISEEDHQKIKKRSGLNKGDILFSNIGTLGNTTIVTQDFEFSCKNVIIFKYKEKQTNFLYTYLTNKNTQNKFLGQSVGVAQKFFSLNFVRTFEDFFPPNYLVEKFDGYVRTIYQLKYHLHDQNQLLREARDILLPRLMTGVIDVESYNPADLLKEVA